MINFLELFLFSDLGEVSRIDILVFQRFLPDEVDGADEVVPG